MGRRAKSPKGKPGSQVTARPQGAEERGSTVNELKRRLAEALRREAEVLDQQLATSEILRVIAGAQTDPQPVFDTIAANALVLCRAASSLVTRFDGEMLHVVAIHNVDRRGAEAHKHNYPMPLNRGAALSRTYGMCWRTRSTGTGTWRRRPDTGVFWPCLCCETAPQSERSRSLGRKRQCSRSGR
jgi:hypothetical protein